MMKRIRLLVVDDDAQVLRGLRMHLAGEPDIEVVGETGDATTAVDLARELRPDVVLMDLLMPVMDGMQAMRLLRAAVPASRIVAFSVRDEMGTRRDVTSAGAAAFVAKQEGPDRLLAAIRDVARCRPSLGAAEA